MLFLANIQPELQRDVLEQCEPRFVALDSMDLWIETARDALVDVIGRIDCLILNDAELRQLTVQPNLVSAAREILGWGPSIVVAKQGEYGAALVTADSFFALPAYPLETVVDPTGAGDTFAGGFVGYLAGRPDRIGDRHELRRAMAYGTALASYNVEEFGTERVARLTEREIDQRVAELGRDHAVRARARAAPHLVTSGRLEPGLLRLLISCPDRPGIVAGVSRFLYESGANIVRSDQYSTDPSRRHVLPAHGVRTGGAREARGAGRARSGSRWREPLRDDLAARGTPPCPSAITVMVSRYDHCLLDLLWRQAPRRARRSASPMVISNHPDLRGGGASRSASRSTTSRSRGAGQAGRPRRSTLRAARRAAVDFVVLARYMQILVRRVPRASRACR